MAREYEVALWRRSPDGIGFPLIGEVVASFPLHAVVVLMKQCRCSRVAYAAVGLGKGRGIVRFRSGVSIVVSDLAGRK